jgi:hypothetical protein
VFVNDAGPVREIYRTLGLPQPEHIDLTLVDKFRRREAVNPELSSQQLWNEIEVAALRFGYRTDSLRSSTNLESVSRHFRQYDRNARGARGFTKVRRSVKAMIMGMLGL